MGGNDEIRFCMNQIYKICLKNEILKTKSGLKPASIHILSLDLLKPPRQKFREFLTPFQRRGIFKVFHLTNQRILSAKPIRFADEEPSDFRSGNRQILILNLSVLQLGKLPDLAHTLL